MQIKITKEIKNESTGVLKIGLPARMVKLMKEYTKCPADQLKDYFDEDDYFIAIVGTENLDAVATAITDIVEPMTEKDFWTSIVTNDGRSMMPADMHHLMRETYGLTGDIEWDTALSFISIGGFVSDPLFCYRSIEEDLEADDCIVMSVKVEE